MGNRLRESTSAAWGVEAGLTSGVWPWHPRLASFPGVLKCPDPGQLSRLLPQGS